MNSIALKLLFYSISHPEHARGGGGKKKSLLTGRNLWQNQNQKAICLDQLQSKKKFSI